MHRRFRLIAQSFELQGSSAAVLQKQVDDDLAKYQKLIREAGLKPNQ